MSGISSFLAKHVVDVKLKPVSLYKSVTAIQLPSTTSEQYEDLLVAQLQRFKSSSDGRHCERLVIFVDDLDRLSASEMVVGLDAVRTFLEMPSPSGLGIVFVISCDEDRVAQALAGRRGRLGSEELPGSVFNRSDARRYLDRLFQFRLEIPRFPKRDMRNYATQKLAAFGPLQANLEKRGVNIQSLTERLIHVGVQSPRNALQILNAFAQSWWLAAEREREGIGSNVSGVLHQGAVTEHPLALAAICVLRVDFPDFFACLQERTDFIQIFSRIVDGTDSVQDQPPRVQEMLSEFLEPEKDGQVFNKVRPQSRPLRQYLSSVQFLQWPRSLQPLLLLAEDAITRQLGPKGPELEDAFVSGDLQGVLEVFGRDNDTKRLRTEDVRLLEDLTETVLQESPEKQVNAARVLSLLPGKLPPGEARGLMTTLARQLVQFKKVRENVGPTETRQVLESVGPTDRQDVTTRFVEDLLKLGGKVEFCLPSGEEANLTEMSDLVRETCELALWVRSLHGLPSATDQQLLEWMRERTVTTASGETQTLPFVELETWMDSHEEHLLEALGSNYTHLVIAQFETDESEGFNNTETLGRISKVFASLAETGEESRQILWSQLGRIVSVKAKEAMEKACDEASRHAETANAEDSSNFVRVMSQRIDQGMIEPEDWLIDKEYTGQTLLEFANRWNSILEDEAIKTFSALIGHWGEEEETAEYAERGYHLIRTNQEVLSNTYSGWVSKQLGDLPSRSRRLLADDFLTCLNDEQRQALATELDRVIALDSVEENIVEDYVRFVKAIPKAAWQKPPLQPHLDRLFSRVAEKYQNQNGYLQQFFPAVQALIPCAPAGRAAAMIQPLFEQAAGLPPVYTMLHGYMEKRWPEENDQTGSYKAQQIFTRSSQFIEQQASTQNADIVVRSMASMVEDGRVSESNVQQMTNAVCLVWPYAATVLPDCLELIADDLKPEQVVQLLQHTSEAGEEAPEILEQVFSTLGVRHDLQQHQNTLVAILNEQPIPLSDEPDGGLGLWINAQGDDQSSILGAVLMEDSLNDKQIERLVQQSVRLAEHLHLEFFVQALPSLFSKAGLEQSRRKIFESIEEITTLANNADEKANLTHCLIEALPSSADQDTLARLTEWIRKNNGQAALEKNKTVLEKLNAEDLEVIVKLFPSSKVLKRTLDILSE